MNVNFQLFYENLIPGVLNYISLFDVVTAFLYGMLLLFITFQFNAKKTPVDKKVLMQTIAYKMFMGVVFTLFYVFYYGGGDSVAYWSVGNSLNELCWKDPMAYLNEMLHFNPNSMHVYASHQIKVASWIILEPESYFVGKLVSLLTFFTFGNLLTVSLFFSYAVGWASFSFYQFIRDQFGKDSFLLRFGILFFPSVAFWCSGITKDTLVLISVLVLVPVLLTVIQTKKLKVKQILLLIVFSWVLLQSRSIVFYCLIAPIIMILVLRSRLMFAEKSAGRTLYTVSILMTLLVTFFLSLGALSSTSAVEEVLVDAQVVQNDFLKNTLYTGAKYDLGIEDFSLTGILVKAPSAIVAGIFRPFPWEAFSPVLLLNGLESLLLLYLFIRHFLFNLRSNMSAIFANEILLYALFFVLLLAFITGLTSVLFGVLVRLRAPLLPFLFLLLTQIKNKQLNR